MRCLKWLDMRFFTSDTSTR